MPPLQRGGNVLIPHHLYVHGSNAVHIVFLEEYEKSIHYANETPAETAALVSEFGILSQNAALIEAAIPACNISFLSGLGMKMMLSTYYAILVPVMPQAFGGEVPDGDIYYIVK